jgi:enoyl-CoA hydratase/carnithine racemase
MPTVLAFAKTLAEKPSEGVALIKQAIHQGVDLTLQEGLNLERKLFFDAIRTEDALRIMRLYVAAGQDREKLQALLDEPGG